MTKSTDPPPNPPSSSTNPKTAAPASNAAFENETLWLTQVLIAELFEVTPQNVTLHLKAIHEEGELDESATCKDYLQVRSEGTRQVSRPVLHYALPAILAVGYRVHSPRGTQFRQCATTRLSEYLLKGFTLADERLKNPPGPRIPDYSGKLLLSC